MQLTPGVLLTPGHGSWPKKLDGTLPNGLEMSDGPTPRARLLAALDAQDPARAAYYLAAQLRDEGVTQAQLYWLFDDARVALEDEDGPRYDAVLDTMDFIVGSCSPHMVLFPGQYLSNETMASRPR